MSDLIDRQAAIDELHGKDPSQIWDTADIEVWLNTLPSAPPKKVCVAEVKVGIDDIKDYIDKTIEERKTGKWLEVEVFPEVYDIEGVKTWGSEMQCDQCGFRHTAIEGRMAQYSYCPNCGSEMQERREDE